MRGMSELPEDVRLAIEAAERAFDVMRAQDQMAKAAGKLTGRYVEVSVADGSAFYVIERVNQRTVRLVCNHAASLDGYQSYEWGPAATIPLARAKRMVEQRDALEAIFSTPLEGEARS